jgi:hypothetical protein
MKKIVHTPEPDTIEINGKTAIILVPELVNDLAVVDFNVIKRLAALLPTANLVAIKNSFAERMLEPSTMEGWVALLRDELSFHETVNLITLIKIEKNEVVQPVSVRRERE